MIDILDQLFVEISIVVITAGAFSLLMYLLKQPLIIAYIATGLVVGPSLLGFAKSGEVFESMSQIGIALLLFLVGINLNWRNIQDVGKISLVVGFGQATFTTVIGWLVARALQFDPVTSLFLALAFAFSSTIVIVKLLTDKQDIDRFYGRISVGMLIVQDLIAMVVLLVVGAFGDGGELQTVLTISALKGIAVVLSLYLLAKYLLPVMFEYAAKSQELLFLTAISWCFAVASVLLFLGFGIEVGALLAGLSLAGSKFHREVESKVRPIRDFFLIIFFIVLGTHLSFANLGPVLVQSTIFSLFILIGNPLIVILLMRFFGYHPRTGFMVGLTVAQISEFSFILLASAIAVGLADDSVLPMATIVGLVTIAGSSYMIQYSERLYQLLEPMFKFMERVPIEDGAVRKARTGVVLIGYDKLGEMILPAVKKLATTYIVVDYDPVAVKTLDELGEPGVYGDAGNEDLLESVRVDKAKMVISTVPDMAVNTDILAFCKMKKSGATVIVTAKNEHEAGMLYALGAHFVILPAKLGGEHFAHLLGKKKVAKTSWNAMAKPQKQALGI